jgi:hypothetical protein
MACSGTSLPFTLQNLASWPPCGSIGKFSVGTAHILDGKYVLRNKKRKKQINKGMTTGEKEKRPETDSVSETLCSLQNTRWRTKSSNSVKLLFSESQRGLFFCTPYTRKWNRQGGTKLEERYRFRKIRYIRECLKCRYFTFFILLDVI